MVKNGTTLDSMGIGTQTSQRTPNILYRAIIRARNQVYRLPDFHASRFIRALDFEIEDTSTFRNGVQNTQKGRNPN